MKRGRHPGESSGPRKTNGPDVPAVDVRLLEKPREQRERKRQQDRGGERKIVIASAHAKAHISGQASEAVAGEPGRQRGEHRERDNKRQHPFEQSCLP